MPTKSSQPFLRETPEGNLPFKPWPRTRSEASFSEFHYDNSKSPPAGVPSARLNHHHSKDCSKDTSHSSQVEKVIRMTPEQELRCKGEYLDGPRIDPSQIPTAAGDLSRNTKIKVCLLANQMEGMSPTVVANTPEGKPDKQKKISGFILDVSRKAPAACSGLQDQYKDPLNPSEEQFERRCKRLGYKIAETDWTWNECQEKSGDLAEFMNQHDPNRVLKGLTPFEIKMHASVKGEKKYNVCGVQDMLPAATEKFTKGDAPPSARHIYENDKRDLQGFERGCRPKGAGGAIEFLGESPEMWGVLGAGERPLEMWRMNQVRNSGYQSSLLSSPAESEFSSYRGYERRRGSAASASQASVTSSQRQLIYSRGNETDRNYKRRSILSTPSGSEVYNNRGSQTSRASMTSSQLEKARWR